MVSRKKIGSGNRPDSSDHRTRSSDRLSQSKKKHPALTCDDRSHGVHTLGVRVNHT